MRCIHDCTPVLFVCHRLTQATHPLHESAHAGPWPVRAAHLFGNSDHAKANSCADLYLAMQRMCFFILKAPVNLLICTLAMHLQAMRLFVGEPVWTPLNRPIDDHASRKKYVETFNASKGFETPGSISSASPIAAH